MGIVFHLINYNCYCDESIAVQQNLVTAFREYGYSVTTEAQDAGNKYDIYVVNSSVDGDSVKIILASESDITENNMNYYESANNYFNVNGDIAGIVITGEKTKKTGINDMNYYFSPMVYVHSFNAVSIHKFASYLVRRYSCLPKIFYEVGDL